MPHASLPIPGHRAICRIPTSQLHLDGIGQLQQHLTAVKIESHTGDTPSDAMAWIESCTEASS